MAEFSLLQNKVHSKPVERAPENKDLTVDVSEIRCFFMSATFSKLNPQSLASTLAGVGAGECGTSLAYILVSKENGSVADMLHHPIWAMGA